MNNLNYSADKERGFITSLGSRRRLSGGGRGRAQINSGIMPRQDAVKVGGIIFGLLLFFYVSTHYSSSPAGGQYLRSHTPMCDTVWCLSSSKNEELHFALVADLDQRSRDTDKKGKPIWKSIFKQGVLFRDADRHWQIKWIEEDELKTKFGEQDRGLELSELITWKDKLWTFDDRTGLVFELDRKKQCIPTYILMEGDGRTTKGQKTEWATVKDGDLYVGSFGKPYVDPKTGEILTRNNLWVSIIHPSGEITHEDWTPHYEAMQVASGAINPGYMVHEAIHWDDIHKLWYVLPRRVSTESYDEKLDELRGSNMLLAFNEDWELQNKMEIGEKIPTHGWSSFKFVPFTNNQVIVALRTMEDEDKETFKSFQQTYITVFDTKGEIFLPETLIPGDSKFEGIEFI